MSLRAVPSQKIKLRKVWRECLLHPENADRYGIVPDGVQFQSKKAFKPLRAADILAWQTQNFMRRIVMSGHGPTDRRKAHKGFLMLRDNRPMDIRFYNSEQLRIAMERIKAFHAEKGIWPREPEACAYPNVRRLAPNWP
jgi:hypothetical protein